MHTLVIAPYIGLELRAEGLWFHSCYASVKRVLI
jgi:hypothetical protein